MAHLSQYDLWGPGDNVVTIISPSRDDVFVVIAIAGIAAVIWPVSDHSRAVQVAEGFARRLRTTAPVTIKVLCVTLAEAQRFGFVPADLLRDQTPAQEAEWRQLVVTTCIDALRDSLDARTRADALKLLTDLGELK